MRSHDVVKPLIMVVHTGRLVRGEHKVAAFLALPPRVTVRR